MPKQHQYISLEDGAGDPDRPPNAPVIFPFYFWSWRWWPVWGSSAAGIQTCFQEMSAAVCNGCFETVRGMGQGKFEPQPPNGWWALRQAVIEECPACRFRCQCNSPIQTGETCFRCSFRIDPEEGWYDLEMSDPPPPTPGQSFNDKKCAECMYNLCDKLSPGDADGSPRWFGKPRMLPTYRIPDAFRSISDDFRRRLSL